MKNKSIILILVALFLTGCVGVSSGGIFGTGVSVALDPRSVGTQIDDSIMQKNLSARIILLDKKHFLSVKTERSIKRTLFLDSSIFLIRLINEFI